jgi:Fe2+ or Zn2+ uptake regulation protein
MAPISNQWQLVQQLHPMSHQRRFHYVNPSVGDDLSHPFHLTQESTMNHLTPILERLRANHYRITKPRLTILSILSESALSFKELYTAYQKAGHHNLATLYNTLDFLEDTKLVFVQWLDGEKIYSFNSPQEVNAHIQLECHDQARRIDVMHHQLIDEIRNHPLFNGFDIDEMDIQVKGHCSAKQKDTCKATGVCTIDKITLNSN